MATSHYQKRSHKVSSTRFCRLLSTYISTVFSTVIWSHRISSSIVRARSSSLQILDWPVPLAFQLRLILTRLWPFGIDVLRSCSDKKHIPLVLTCGQLGASLLKWSRGDLCSWATQRSIKCSRFSRFWEHQTRVTGQIHFNLNNLNQRSLSLRAWKWLSTPQLSLS